MVEAPWGRLTLSSLSKIDDSTTNQSSSFTLSSVQLCEDGCVFTYLFVMKPFADEDVFFRCSAAVCGCGACACALTRVENLLRISAYARPFAECTAQPKH